MNYVDIALFAQVQGHSRFDSASDHANCWFASLYTAQPCCKDDKWASMYLLACLHRPAQIQNIAKQGISCFFFIDKYTLSSFHIDVQ